MKRVYKKLIWGYLQIFVAASIIGTMIVPYNGLMWILKIILFWTFAHYGFITVDRCNTELCKKEQITKDETQEENKEK